MGGNTPENRRYTDKQIVEHRFNEVKFFLGEMEKANLMFSRNIHNIRPGDFKFYLNAFCGALYSIEDFIESVDEYLDFDDWIDEEGAERQMYELFLGDEHGIRHENIHMKRVNTDQETTRKDIAEMRLTRIGGGDGVDFAFEGEPGGILKPELLQRYGDEFGDHPYVPVIDVADEFVHDVVYYCLEEQGLIRAEGENIDYEDGLNF